MKNEFQNGLGKPVTANFFHGCVDDVAAKLIGCFLFVERDDGRLGGQIIETEAYCEYDPASHCHSAASRRRRNLSDPMRLAGGHIYMHHDRTWCMNLTCGTNNFGSAVLIRALKPIGTTKELGAMRGRRRDWYQSVCLDDDNLFQKNLCNRPGNLCMSLGISGNYNRKPINDTDIKIYAPASDVSLKINCGPRINIPRTNCAKDWYRRYVLADPAIAGFVVSWSKADKGFTPDLMAEMKQSGKLSECKCAMAT